MKVSSVPRQARGEGGDDDAKSSVALVKKYRGPYKGLTVFDRFWAKVYKDGPIPIEKPGLGQCWVWMGAKDFGYGVFTVGNSQNEARHGIKVRAHMFAWEMACGPVPDGLELDHLCRNPSCIRVSHLEAVTPRENQIRGNTFSARNIRKTHCPKGHPYDHINTLVYRNRRACRKCHADREQRRREIRRSQR